MFTWQILVWNRLLSVSAVVEQHGEDLGGCSTASYSDAFTRFLLFSAGVSHQPQCFVRPPATGPAALDSSCCSCCNCHALRFTALGQVLSLCLHCVQTSKTQMLFFLLLLLVLRRRLPLLMLLCNYTGCDNVQSIVLVTPTGQLVKASSRGVHQMSTLPSGDLDFKEGPLITSDTSLFWALRGGGGGAFGVAVQFGMKLVPAPSAVQSVTVTWLLYDAQGGQRCDCWQLAALNCFLPALYVSVVALQFCSP